MKYVVQLTITMVAETEAKDAKFYFEEQNCNDNLIAQLYEECERAGECGVCATCYRAEAKLIREASAEDIAKYGPNCATSPKKHVVTLTMQEYLRLKSAFNAEHNIQKHRDFIAMRCNRNLWKSEFDILLARYDRYISGWNGEVTP